MLKICGPKCSICWVLLSIWGILQLGLMGVFYYIHSLTFLSDMALDESLSIEKLQEQAGQAFEKTAYNCWIAAGIYAFTLIFSSCQLFVNQKRG